MTGPIDRSASVPSGAAAAAPVGALRALWRRRVVEPLAALLRQGLSPDRLALALAVGAVIGVTPALGTTTALCALVGLRLGLNQVALQTANYAVYALQLALLIPFYQAGAALFGYEVPVDSAAAVVEMVSAQPWETVVALWSVTWRAVLVWALAALPAVALLYWPLRIGTRALAAVVERRSGD